jgi:hypothetical protein
MGGGRSGSYCDGERGVVPAGTISPSHREKEHSKMEWQ